MSIAIAIENLSSRIQDAYVALSAKGATMPAEKTTANLSSTINSIPEPVMQDKKTVVLNRNTDTTTMATLFEKDIYPDEGYDGISHVKFRARGLNLTVNPTTSQQVKEAPIANGTIGYKTVTINPVTSSIDSNIQAENIKKDVNILGVTGTYEGEGGGGGDIVFGMSQQHQNSNDNSDPYAIKIFVDGQIVWDWGYTGFCIKNPTSIQFTSEYWGDNPWLRLKYADGTTQDINSATTITNLTQSVVVQEYHGFSCLDGNTTITMKDWNKKPISKISIGDEILCLNPETMKFDYDIVDSCDSDEIKWHDEKDIWRFDDRTEVTTIHPHEFYNITHQKFMYIADFKIGDKIYKLDGTTPKLVEHKNVKENVRHFTLFTKKFNNYFANGILTGNRHSTVIKQLEG